MTISTTWSVNQMTHNDSDGGVILVYWSCVARNQTGTDGLGNPVYDSGTATEGGKLRLEPDPTSPDYIPYADLTESDVLGWVYNSLIEGDETADQAKARVEADRTAKVQGQIDRAASQSDGLPWAASPEA